MAASFAGCVESAPVATEKSLGPDDASRADNNHTTFRLEATVKTMLAYNVAAGLELRPANVVLIRHAPDSQLEAIEMTLQWIDTVSPLDNAIQVRNETELVAWGGSPLSAKILYPDKNITYIAISPKAELAVAATYDWRVDVEIFVSYYITPETAPMLED